jgi:hypothetical protein
MKKSTTTAVDFIGGGEKYRTPMSVTKIRIGIRLIF